MLSRCLLLLFLLTGLGCTATIPDGRFECDVDGDCPPELTCDTRNNRCYRPDGG